MEGNRKLLADAILSAFIGEPEFAGNFLDSLFLNLNSAVKKNGISLHTQEEETEESSISLPTTEKQRFFSGMQFFRQLEKPCTKTRSGSER